jgi:hypothetical protein
MESGVPLIRSVPLQPLRLGVGGRLLAGFIAAGCLGLLVTAAVLKPNPNGTGTHTALGLESCQFMQRTGIPCPSCGMTTSFAYFVRGNILASLYVQPMGTLLAFLAAMTFWLALYVAVSGKPAYRMLRFLPGNKWVMGLVFFGILAWGWKIYIHVGRHDGWGK